MPDAQTTDIHTRGFSNRQNIIAAILIVLAITIAWLGSFDKTAGIYINDSIKNTAILYGTARGINAIVSLIQSMEIGAVIASVHFGELLDPINDTIERFSEIMTYAIISLTLQKILLEIVEHNIFNILLTLSGLSLLLQLFVGNRRYIDFSLKTLLTLVFIRLSLSLVLILNMGADRIFIADKIVKEQTSVQAITPDLNNIYSVIKGDKSVGTDDGSLIVTPKASAKTSDIEARIEALSRQKEDIHAQIEEQEKLVSNQSDEADKIASKLGGWWDRLTTDSPELTQAEKKLDTLKEGLGEIEQRDHEISAKISDEKSKLVCEQKRARGESCSMTEKWENIKQKLSIKSLISKLESTSKEWFDSVLTLLTLIILKSILLPLLFWYAMLKGIKQLWKIEWAASTGQNNAPMVVNR